MHHCSCIEHKKKQMEYEKVQPATPLPEASAIQARQWRREASILLLKGGKGGPYEAHKTRILGKSLVHGKTFLSQGEFLIRCNNAGRKS